MSGSDSVLLRDVLTTPVQGGADAQERPPPDRVAAARDRIAVLGDQLQGLVRSLQATAAGDTVTPRAQLLLQEMDTLDGDGDRAEGIVEQVRICLHDAYDARDAEDMRRRDAVTALDTAGRQARTGLDAVRPSLPMLQDGETVASGLTSAADTFKAANGAKHLAMLGPSATEFDAAISTAMGAADTLQKAVDTATQQVRSERESRRDTLAQLGSDAKNASDALNEALEHAKPLFAPAAASATPEAAKKHAQTLVQRQRMIAKAVPNWDERTGLQDRLAREMPDTVATAPYAGFTEAVAARREDCSKGTDLAANLNKWVDGFNAVRPAGASANKKMTEFTAKVPEAKAELAIAMKAIADAIEQSAFDDATVKINAMVQTLDGLTSLGNRAKDYPEAAGFLKTAAKRVAAALNDPEADPDGQITELAETLDEAERVQPRLAGATSNFAQRGPKLPKDMTAIGAAMTKLAPPKGGPPTVGALFADPAALDQAAAFEAASTNLRAFTDAKGDANIAIAYFADRELAQADGFYKEVHDIIGRADPLADRGFVAAIGALRELTSQVNEARKAREKNRAEADRIEKQIGTAIGKDTKPGKELLKRLSGIDLGDVDAAARFERLAASIEGIKENSAALQQVLKDGDAALGNVSLGLPKRVELKNKAENALAAQIASGSSGALPEIQALQDANRFLKTFHDAFRHVESDIDEALKLRFPDELVADLRQHNATARDSAANLVTERAMPELKSAELLAGVILASSAQFEALDAIIEHGTPEQKRDLPAKPEAGVALGRTWTGTGKAFAQQFAKDIGNLDTEVANAYAAQRAQRKPDEVALRHQAITPVYATLEGTPPPPANPAALMGTIDTLVQQRKLQDAFRKLSAEFDPLAKEIARIHPLLAGITGFQADWAAIKANYLAALTNAHPDQKAELSTMKEAAEGERLTDPPAGRTLLAKLPARITAITNKGAGWKGIVPNALAATRPTNHATAGAAETAAKALLADGGLTHDNIRSLIPVATPTRPAVANTFGASAKYPRGFKYVWQTDDGKTITLYGHGPSTGPGVDPSSISSQGNIIRVLINGKYLQSDGTTKVKSTTDKGHIPLFGNP